MCGVGIVLDDQHRMPGHERATLATQRRAIDLRERRRTEHRDHTPDKSAREDSSHRFILSRETCEKS